MGNSSSVSGSGETLKVVCISDTHSLHDGIQVPDGDILIHAGDFTNLGLPEEVEGLNEWLGKLPHKHKIVIAGNHDLTFDTKNYTTKLESAFHGKDYGPVDSEKVKATLKNCIYLEDSSVTIEGYKIYGSPWTPEFGRWAFMLDSDEKMLEKWKMIPNDTDILITHGPPKGILDLVYPDNINAGCPKLKQEVLKRVKPIYHIFGHIHEGYGTLKKDKTTFVNASNCTLRYQPSNPPIVFELPKKQNDKVFVNNDL